MKVLMFLEEDKLSPRGGPYGVGYYYHCESKRRGDNIVDFIKSNEKNSKQKDNLKQYKNMIPKPLIQLRSRIRNIISINRLFSRNVQTPFGNIDFCEYDIIHFQTTLHLYQQREKLKDYQGIVLLSSHSPVPLAQEVIGSLSKIEKMLIPHVEIKYNELDKYSFNRADYLIFPCPEAEEPYFNTWNYYNEIHNNKKYKYVPTGIASAKAEHTIEEIRSKIGIGRDDFVISFVGRHNEVKGYDILKRIGLEFLSENPDARFLICGKEEPLKGLDDKRWIEVGWTKDQYSYIASSDVFVLPNRQTYFDLVMLEVLSLGKIVIASRTGGNKFFEKMNANGVFLYDTEEEAVELLNSVKKMKEHEKKKLEDSNRHFFEKYLTASSMYNEYLKVIQEIIKESSDQ